MYLLLRYPPIPGQYPVENQKFPQWQAMGSRLSEKCNLDGWLFFRVRTSVINSRMSPLVSCCSLCIWCNVFIISAKISVRGGGSTSLGPRITTFSVSAPTFPNSSWCCCNGGSRGPAHLYLIPTESKAPVLEKLWCWNNHHTLHTIHWFSFL